MKKPLRKISLKTLAYLVGNKLREHGIDAVLTGGACVSIYSGNKYQSLDLDFVTSAVEYKQEEIITAMGEVGFSLKKEGFFENSDCKYIIEFIPPPLAVGREPVKKILTLKSRAGCLRLISPDDCVKDRLSAFYHWDDLQSLEQALMVANKHKIDLREIARWSKVENKADKYAVFLKRLKLLKKIK